VIVLDACVALGWFVDDERGSFAALDAVAQTGGIVPGNFQSEVAHALVRAERRGRMTATQSARVLAALADLALRVHFPDPHLVLALAREHGLTGYDACYLATAIETGCRLATTDATLNAAALKAAVAL
jgi:predicted nucleic acid-binding protein